MANVAAQALFGTAGEWDLPRGITPKRELLYLAVGIPDSASLPKAELAAAAARVLAKPGDVALRYGFGAGPTGIREWLAARRNSIEGCTIDADWFQLTNGSSGAIDLIVRSLIEPGDVIVAEQPTYMGSLHNFRGVRADVRFVPMDRDGMDMDALSGLLSELAAAGKRVKLIYTISAYHNPTGVTLSLARRQRLLELASEHDALVLDDEAYRDLWYDAPPPRAISALSDGYGVVTTGTLSKSVATGLRVGWIHARPELLALFSRMRFAMGANQFGLRTVGEFLEAGCFEPHLARMRDTYRHKRDLLHGELQRQVSDYFEWDLPAGGFYFWAKLKQGMQVQPLWRTAVEEGIAINPGSGFMPAGATAEPRIRIAFAWTPEHQFAAAAERLRLACERVLAGDAA
ncbi:MAG: PLP-dependent aminotransferase family protein [Gammaproteobacteria bacterium]|nr:PLP-dependent aminotransferase family protein [Gammaproteobacteria bacterium]